LAVVRQGGYFSRRINTVSAEIPEWAEEQSVSSTLVALLTSPRSVEATTRVSENFAILSLTNQLIDSIGPPRISFTVITHSHDLIEAANPGNAPTPETFGHEAYDPVAFGGRFPNDGLAAAQAQNSLVNTRG
jgi:hypothetical protein